MLDTENPKKQCILRFFNTILSKLGDENKKKNIEENHDAQLYGVMIACKLSGGPFINNMLDSRK